MFQFPGFALKTLCIQVISTWLTRLLTSDDDNNQISGGFPHSEISGSKPIPGSPKLIAGYRVLHRLLLPRHPPNALIALDLIRKKKDPHHCSVLRGTWRPREASSVKACIIYSRLPPKEKTWLVYLTWTTPPFVPKNNRTPTRVRPTTLIISLNDVNATQGPRRPTGRESDKRAFRSSRVFCGANFLPRAARLASKPKNSPPDCFCGFAAGCDGGA